MSKYKLIKTYPGSPELGYIAKYTGNVWDDGVYFSYDINPEKYSEFWEKVVEKDYEILSFNLYGNHLCYKWQNHFNGYTEDKILTNSEHKIHSIKRLSDGEVFTIGDKIKTFDCGYKPISSIKIEDNICKIGIREHGLRDLKHCIKQSKLLFTTKDGIDVYVGMSSCLVHKNTWTLGDIIQHNNEHYKYFEPSAASWWFSTKEKAEEYILLNKPCLSIKDVLPLIKFSNNAENKRNELTKLVKSRL